MTHSIHQWPDGIMGQSHFVLSGSERTKEVWGLHKLAKIVISLENNGYPNVFPIIIYWRNIYDNHTLCANYHRDYFSDFSKMTCPTAEH